MKQLYLSDQDISAELYPLSMTRPVADLRIGILTIREKWQRLLGSDWQVDHLDGDSPANALVMASNIIPSEPFAEALKKEADVHHASRETVRLLTAPWQIFLWNDRELRADFALLTRDRISLPVPPTVQATAPHNIFIEEGAILQHCIINASAGPVYIGRNAEVMEGAMLRGPLAICEGAVIKMGAKLYGASTIGPYSVAGGEIKNAVIMGYSNKSHDGYLGDSVIGEWCNLGAGTSNSNMKNNAGEVRLYHPASGTMKGTGLNKCGLIMGDYSRSAIHTAFNTGTVVGVCAHVFGSGTPPAFVPNFSWGTTGSKYEYEKALVDIERWKQLKGHSLSEQEKKRLKLIFETH